MLVLALAAVARIVGLSKEIAIAAAFGTGPQIDAFVIAFNLLSAPISIWFAAIFAVLVPALTSLERRSPEDASQFRGEFLTVTLVAGVSMGLLFWGALHVYFASGTSGLDQFSAEAALAALPLLWPMVPLLFVAQYWATCLMARNRHGNTLFEGLPAFVVLVAVVVAPANIVTLALATLLGILLQGLFTAVATARANSFDRPRLPRKSTLRDGMGGFLLVMLFVQSLQTGVSVVDQVLAAKLPAGSLSGFQYALRAQGIITSMLALALPRVLLPALSARIDAHPEEKRAFVVRWASLFAFIGILSATIASIFAEPIISLLFERGSFQSSDTAMVADLFAILMWQIPLYLLIILFSQVFAVAQNYKSLALIAAVTLIVKIGIGTVLSQGYGLIGLTASVPLVAACQLLLLLIVGSWHTKRNGAPRIS